MARRRYNKNNNYYKRNSAAEAVTTIVFLVIVGLIVALFASALGGDSKKSYENPYMNSGGTNWYDLQEANRGMKNYWKDNPEAYQKHKQESNKAKEYRNENY